MKLYNNDFTTILAMSGIVAFLAYVSKVHILKRNFRAVSNDMKEVSKKAAEEDFSLLYAISSVSTILIYS